MSPGNWVAIILGLVAVCWIAGVYIEIANYEIDEMQAQADMEAMLKADGIPLMQPHVRAGTEPIIHKGFPHGH